MARKAKALSSIQLAFEMGSVIVTGSLLGRRKDLGFTFTPMVLGCAMSADLANFGNRIDQPPICCRSQIFL